MKLRVLVADDDRDTADSLAQLARLWGYEVRTAYDGPSALTLALEWYPDVAVLDLGLPGLDGLAVAARIKQECPSVELMLAVTGYSPAFFKPPLDHVAAGFHAYLLKPLELVVLHKLLEAAQLKRQQRG